MMGDKTPIKKNKKGLTKPNIYAIINTDLGAMANPS